MEDYNQKNKFNNDPEPDWEVDDAQKEHLKSLGLWEDDSYDENELISKI